MDDIVIIILIVAFGVVAVFFLGRWRIRRATWRIIRTFRDNSATSIKTAKTLEDLGLIRKTWVERTLTLRDYRKFALTLLMQTDIIQQTEDGRLYLSEEQLGGSGLDKSSLYSR